MREELLRRLEPYRGEERTLVASQDTEDIIRGIDRWHRQYGHQYDAVSSFFAGRTARETGDRIFRFLKRYVEYRIETDARQTLKTPAAILATGHGDCKHYALFAGGVLDSLARTGQQRIPWSFRFASYRWYDETPQHVFVVLFPGTSREIWLDPVLARYDQKKPYTHATDTKMALVGISGVKKDAQIAGLKDFLKKGKTVVLKVAAAPSRAAFLGLVTLNVFGLGTKLWAVWQKNPASMKNWWAGLGGQIDKLVSAAEKGSKKRKILGDTVGEVTVGSVIIAAAPVLTAVLDLLKKNNQEAGEIEAAARGGLDIRAREAMMEEVQPEVIDEARQELIERKVEESSGTPARRQAIGTGALVAAGALVFLLVSRRR